jgi:sterol desaturase/sphingolipid hydroxylase (fatty acid hydroxylase superfamily)
LLFLCGTVFHHSNVHVPVGLERVVNLVFVTPRMHGIHHSAIRDETNSNYSVVFRWWDSLHRSLRLNVPQDAVTIGVPAYLEPEDNRVRSVLAMPLRRQRRYWRRTEGIRTSRADAETRGPPSRMAP